MTNEELQKHVEKTHRFIDLFDIPRQEENQPLSLTVRLSRLLQKLGVDPKAKRAEPPQNFTN